MIVMGLVILGCGIVVMKRSNHSPTEPEHKPPAVNNPTFSAAPGNADYAAAQTLNPEYQPTLPERMYRRDYAEIEPEPDEAIQPPSPRKPTYNEVQMYDQTPRQTAQYVSLEGSHQTFDWA